MQIKIGDSVIVAGRAVKDAEYKLVGSKDSPLCSFGLSVGKRQDTTTIFANCKAWYGLAQYAANIQKGDTVIVTGHTESREYNGKTYTDLVAEWLNIISAESEVRKTAPSGVPYPQGVKFEEDGSDESLPF